MDFAVHSQEWMGVVNLSRFWVMGIPCQLLMSSSSHFWNSSDTRFSTRFVYSDVAHCFLDWWLYPKRMYFVSIFVTNKPQLKQTLLLQPCDRWLQSATVLWLFQNPVNWITDTYTVCALNFHSNTSGINVIFLNWVSCFVHCAIQVHQEIPAWIYTQNKLCFHKFKFCKACQLWVTLPPRMNMV